MEWNGGSLLHIFISESCHINIMMMTIIAQLMMMVRRNVFSELFFEEKPPFCSTFAESCLQITGNVDTNPGTRCCYGIITKNSLSLSRTHKHIHTQIRYLNQIGSKISQKSSRKTTINSVLKDAIFC